MFSKLTCLFVSYLESSKKNLFKVSLRLLLIVLYRKHFHVSVPIYATIPLYHTPPTLFTPPPPLHLAMNMSKRVWSGRTYEYVPHSLELIRKCFLSNFHETHHLLFTKTWRKYEIFCWSPIGLRERLSQLYNQSDATQIYAGRLKERAESPARRKMPFSQRWITLRGPPINNCPRTKIFPWF